MDGTALLLPLMLLANSLLMVNVCDGAASSSASASVFALPLSPVDDWQSLRFFAGAPAVSSADARLDLVVIQEQHPTLVHPVVIY